MNQALQPLIDALREELQEYGGMLALLDEQQDLVVRRAPADLLDSVARIQVQTETIQRARRLRQEHQAELARRTGLPSEATIAEIRPHIPEEYRPLVEALVRENN